MSTTIPALSSVDDILDSDLVMITHSNGESFKIAGSEINKRNQAVIASGTTITGAPLKTGNIVRVYFTADITGSNTSTGLTLNYNSVNKSVKVPKNGTLANFVASDLGGSPTVYKYLQAHTTLELLYDGTQFIIIGNPVVLSSSDYTIYADGYHTVNSVTNGNMSAVTSNAVASSVLSLLRGEFSQKFKVLVSGYFNNSNWSAGVMHEGGYHSYLVIAQRLGNGDTYFAIVNTLGEENNKEYVIKEIVNVGFTIEHNQFGTFIVEYSDPSNIWNYTIFVAQLA